MRVDHWIKNVFVVPGIVLAVAEDPSTATPHLLFNILWGLAATCVIASSNYVINELLDAPFDGQHPVKRSRPVPSGRVNVSLAYAQWLLLFVLGMAMSLCVSLPFALCLLALWIMGCIYNIPPVRSKDVPYLDVLSEAVNNPIRMLAGWLMVGPRGIVPASLLLSYWMMGCYFMAVKRFAELRHIGSISRAGSYRKSFAYYTERRLIVSIVFCASAAMLFLGAFIMRYRLELILAVPLISLVMAIYLDLGFKEDSPVQAPEKLHREPVLLSTVVVCALVLVLLFFVDIPLLGRIFKPSIP